MLFSLILFGLFSALTLAMLRGWHRPWWNVRWLRRAAIGVVVMGLVGVALRSIGLGSATPGASQRVPALTIAGAALMGPASVLILMSFLSLPLAAIVRLALRLVTRGPRETSAPASSFRAASVTASTSASSRDDERAVSRDGASESAAPAEASSTAVAARGPFVLRRALLEGAIAAIPTAALGAGVVGVIGAYGRTRIVPRPMRFAGLSPDLAGLKILQLTDLHLGAFLDPEGVARIVEDARQSAPDLVLLTGDFSDHLPWLRPALDEVLTLRPRLGTFAVLGNHEHYRGADENRRIYAQAGVDLLTDAHRVLRVGGGDLTIVGVDDPGRYGTEGHFERAIDRGLASAPSQGMRLGLCHRPSGFPALAARGVDLTLSGHTHGAQVGVGERSILEKVAPEGRLWGRYSIGDRQLYTSSGAGHWFAFRLNCPSEAALVTLERA